MSHHRLLCLTVLLLAWTNPAWSFVAYVSNEKSNTVSVIDTDTWCRKPSCGETETTMRPSDRRMG